MNQFLNIIALGQPVTIDKYRRRVAYFCLTPSQNNIALHKHIASEIYSDTLE